MRRVGQGQRKNESVSTSLRLKSALQVWCSVSGVRGGVRVASLTSLMICTCFMLRCCAISSPSSTQLTLVMILLFDRTGPATAKQHATAGSASLLYCTQQPATDTAEHTADT